MCTVKFNEDGTIVVPVVLLADHAKDQLVNDPQNVPREIILALVEGADSGNSSAIQRLRTIVLNQKTPPEILTELAEKYWDEKILPCFAENPATPPEILWKIFSQKTSWDIIKALSGNSKCPPELLKKILPIADRGMAGSGGETEDLRRPIIELILFNPNTDDDTAMEILDSWRFEFYRSDNVEERGYKQSVKESLGKSSSKRILKKLLEEDLSVGLFSNIMTNKNADEEIIRDICKQMKNYGTTAILNTLIAAHPQTPKDILKGMSTYEGVAGQVAANNLKTRET